MAPVLNPSSCGEQSGNGLSYSSLHHCPKLHASIKSWPVVEPFNAKPRMPVSVHSYLLTKQLTNWQTSNVKFWHGWLQSPPQDGIMSSPVLCWLSSLYRCLASGIHSVSYFMHKIPCKTVLCFITGWRSCRFLVCPRNPVKEVRVSAYDPPPPRFI
jgi:hypothetical protein